MSGFVLRTKLKPELNLVMQIFPSENQVRLAEYTGSDEQRWILTPTGYLVSCKTINGLKLFLSSPGKFHGLIARSCFIDSIVRSISSHRRSRRESSSRAMWSRHQLPTGGCAWCPEVELRWDRTSNIYEHWDSNRYSQFQRSSRHYPPDLVHQWRRR